MKQTQKHLYRRFSSKVIAGVCGGLADYLNIDPLVIRIAWIVLTFLGGSGIVLYIAGWIIIPVDPGRNEMEQVKNSGNTPAALFGGLFVAVGIILLLDNLDILSFHHFWRASWDYFLPVTLIMIGIFFLARRRTDDETPGGIPPQEIPKGDPDVHGAGETRIRKTLHRSRSDRKISGICGGFGEYFGIDSSLVRIAYVLFTLFSGGFGIILYFLLLLVIPEDAPHPGTP